MRETIASSRTLRGSASWPELRSRRPSLATLAVFLSSATLLAAWSLEAGPAPAAGSTSSGGGHEPAIWEEQRVWIGGRVALAGDAEAPGAGARVLLLREETLERRDRRLLAGEPKPKPVEQTRSDSRGWFRLKAPGAGPWILRVELDGWISMQHRILPVPDEQELAPVLLRRGRLERLRMVDPAGRPAADSWAELVSSSLDGAGGGSWGVGGGSWRRAGWAGWLDAEGRLELPRAEGEQIVLALGNGWGRERVAVGPAPSDAQVAHEPWDEVALLAVSALDQAGAPVPDAVLRVGGIPWTLTDEGGVGVLPAPRDASVEGIGPNGARGRLATVALESEWFGDGDSSGDPPLHAVTVVLEPARRLRGRVRSADGRPLIGAWVLSGGSWSRTGPRGELEAIAPEGEGNLIEVGAVGHRWESYPLSRWRDGLVLTLQPTAIAEGFVLDAAGRALPGAELVALPTARRSTAERAALGSAAESAALGPAAEPAAIWARSRDDGSFRLRDLEPRTLHALTARHPDLPVAEERFGAPGPSEVRSDLRIVLRAPRRVFGLVVGGDDLAPVAGARVWIEGLEDRPGAERLVVTGEDGAFAWDDIPDATELDVRVVAEGFAPGSVVGVETPVDQPGDVDLGEVVLERGHGLTVVVRDADGQLLERASVGVDVRAPLRPPGPAPSRGPRQSGSWAWKLTDELGEARFDGLPGGGLRSTGDRAAGRDVTVYATHEDHVSVEIGVGIPRDGPLELTLRAGSTVWGTVVDEDGRRLENVFVAAFPSGPMMLSPDDLVTRTDEEGRYLITGVPAGRHRVEARPVGQAEIEPVELTVVAQERHRVDFRVPPSALVEGRVVDGRGLPVADATVVAAGRLTHTGDEGEFRLDRVRLGEQLFEVRHRDRRTVTRRVTVAGDLWLDFELGRGAGVVGQIVSIDGEPLEGVDLRLIGVGFARHDSTFSGTGGQFSFTDVEPGTYRIEVMDRRLVPVDASGGGRIEVTVSEEAAVEVTIRVLVGETTLRGRVTGMPAPGEAPNGVLVTVSSRDGRHRGMVGEDGSFVIEGLVPGRWTVRAASVEGHRSSGPPPAERPPVYEGTAEVMIEPGEREVSVVVDLQAEDPHHVRFSGRVTVDGAAPMGTHLLLTAVNGSSMSMSSLDALGEFEHGRVRAGIYELTVGALDTTLTRLATLDLRSDLDLDLELFRMTAAGAIVDGSTGAAIEGAEVFIVAPGGPVPGEGEGTSVVSLRGGVFQVDAIVPHTARLLFRRRGYEPAAIDVGPGVWTGLRVRLVPADGAREDPGSLQRRP